MWYKPKTKLRFRDQSNRVWSVLKTRQDNDMTNHTSGIFVLYFHFCDKFILSLYLNYLLKILKKYLKRKKKKREKKKKTKKKSTIRRRAMLFVYGKKWVVVGWPA